MYGMYALQAFQWPFTMTWAPCVIIDLLAWYLVITRSHTSLSTCAHQDLSFPLKFFVGGHALALWEPISAGLDGCK